MGKLSFSSRADTNTQIVQQTILLCSFHDTRRKKYEACKGTLPSTNIAPVGGLLEDLVPLARTPCQVPLQRGMEAIPQFPPPPRFHFSAAWPKGPSPLAARRFARVKSSAGRKFSSLRVLVQISRSGCRTFSWPPDV